MQRKYTVAQIQYFVEVLDDIINEVAAAEIERAYAAGVRDAGDWLDTRLRKLERYRIAPTRQRLLLADLLLD